MVYKERKRRWKAAQAAKKKAKDARKAAVAPLLKGNRHQFIEHDGFVYQKRLNNGRWEIAEFTPEAWRRMNWRSYDDGRQGDPH
jgi:hypothetical protein